MQQNLVIFSTDLG